MNSFRSKRTGVSLVIAASLFVMGCDNGAPEGLNRQYVKGTVTLDGEPLPKGSISFDPAEGQAGGVSSGAPIVDGSYAIPRESGPTPGKYRVSIRSAGAGDEAPADAAPGLPPRRKPAGDPIPKQYNTASTLTADVKDGGTTTADFPLTTK